MKDKAEDFFTESEEQSVVEAIKAAEKDTSGEIRVHLENHSQKDNLSRAKEVFQEIGMTKTELQNGVLFYLAVQDHQFSILGDKGINEKVPDNFWDGIKNAVQEHFKKGDFAKGLSEGIMMAGKALKEHFPYQDDDVNELPDQISKS